MICHHPGTKLQNAFKQKKQASFCKQVGTFLAVSEPHSVPTKKKEASQPRTKVPSKLYRIVSHIRLQRKNGYLITTNLILFRPVNTMYAWLMKSWFDILQRQTLSLPCVRQYLQSDQMGRQK
jgi:hypothetical protein